MAEVKEPAQPGTSGEAHAGKIVYGEDSAAENYAGRPGPAEKKKKPRKKVKKWIILIVVLAAVAAGILFLAKFLGKSSAKEDKVITNDVQYGSITSTVTGSGLTKAKNSQTITITTAGTVQEVMVAEGDRVTAGTPLFTIDSPAARTAVQTAQNTVNGYEKRLRGLQKDIAGLNLSAAYAGKLMDTAKLQKGDTISKGDKVATLADDTHMRLKQYYSYAYRGEIRAGQSASVSLPGLMSTLTGRVEAVHMVSRITPEGSKLFEADIVLTNPGTLSVDMTASATLSAKGETVYPYEPGKLEYYRSGDLKSTVSGTILSSSLVDYMSVSAGQVLVRIDGEDSENEIFTTEQQLETAQQDLKKAQDNLANCSAVAPIDGTVMGLSIAPGNELTGTATAVVTIADTSVMLINATVDERNISFVKVGMPVDIKDLSDSSYMGTVESVSLASKVENGVASYPMVISVDNADGSVINGGNVNYSLVASQNDNCLLLPIQCVKYVQMDDGSSNTVVFVKSGSKPDGAIDLPTWPDDVPKKGYYPVPVETGISDDNNIEIKSGVDEGATVFTAKQVTSSWG
ncbi:MAG: HlyD family efflux transporter periplasmic adaptor subunit [Oscillibacter sp.]|jgi:multidrug efflux pump subunit AcrA (membrane-fusion protein)|nr:HlyD family efflux transporter periplasmic adaptor subunit [Oscillibacter sp.]